MIYFQPTDLMYAELAFPRTHYSNSGSLPRRKTADPTVYAKLSPSTTAETPHPHATLGRLRRTPSSYVAGGGGPDQQSYPSHIKVAIPHLTVRPCTSAGDATGQRNPSYSLGHFSLQDGVSPTCLSSYKTSTGYEGPIPPPALPDEELNTHAETPLMGKAAAAGSSSAADNKESQV